MMQYSEKDEITFLRAFLYLPSSSSSLFLRILSSSLHHGNASIPPPSLSLSLSLSLFVAG